MTESKEQLELTARINELAKKAKDEGLTDEEVEERKTLRAKFLKNFRESFKSNIEMMQVFDKEGNEVTPEKVKKIQRERNLRDD